MTDAINFLRIVLSKSVVDAQECLILRRRGGTNNQSVTQGGGMAQRKMSGQGSEKVLSSGMG